MDQNLQDIFLDFNDFGKKESEKSSVYNAGTILADSYHDYCEDITLNNLPDSIEEIELQIDRLKTRWNEFTYLIGQRLKYVNDNRLFEKKGYTEFATYARVALKMSENNAYYYISIFEYFTEEQTKIAGSKLKLIIPILNKIKKDKDSPEENKNERIDNIKKDLFERIKNQSYRDAEKTIKDIRKKYFHSYNEEEIFKNINKIEVKNDRIIIYEADKDIQQHLIKVIENFYL